MTDRPVKTRFAPSPTGSLHVGGARTALFNYALARKLGGTFLLRIEDTDRARHQEQAVAKIVDDLRWLGLDWDEGVEIGGPAEPYRQSERLEMYREKVQSLLDAGKAYYAFETAEELDARRRDAEQNKTTYLYRRDDRDPASFPTAQEASRQREAGRPVVVRFLNPTGEVTVRDEVFGEVAVPADQQDDFVIAKADGWPTYHLANVVDDGLMGVTHVLRGQEFLGQTWRHELLRQALGLTERTYAHLPLILDMQGKKLSKRDGAVEVESFRKAGYLPEALVNFLALLGWNPKSDRETFSLAEFVEAFDLAGLGKANAKFDRGKLQAFNTDAAAAASDDRLAACFADFLARNDTPIPAGDPALLERLLRECAGFRTFQDVVEKAGVLLAPDDAYPFDDKAVKKNLAKNDGAGFDVLGELRDTLADAELWSPEALEALLKDFAEARRLGMGKVAQPLRVAVAGTSVSPGIGATLDLLGKDRTLARIDRCLAELGPRR